MDLVIATLQPEYPENASAPAPSRERVGSGESIVLGVSIWDFTDYRAYLKHAFAAAKAQGTPVSNRWLARQLGLKSFSFITMMLQGKRNLTRVNREKLARMLGLSGEEGDYFAALVEFNQARNADDRDRALRSLSLLQRPGHRRVVSNQVLTLSPEGYVRLCGLIQELGGKADAVSMPEQGGLPRYGLGLQLFPIPPETSF